MKILGVGAPLIDIIINISEERFKSLQLRKGDSYLVEQKEFDDLLSKFSGEYTISFGGSVANTVAHLLELKADASLLGIVADDEWGQKIQTHYTSLGMRHHSLIIKDFKKTGACVCLVTPDGERTMLAHLGASALWGEDMLTDELFQNFKHIHIEGYIIFAESFFYSLLEKAKQYSCKISLDLSSIDIVEHLGEKLDKLLLNFIDIIFLNEQEAIATKKGKNAIDVLISLSKLSSVVALKLGKKGSCLACDGNFYQKDAYKVNCIDSVGAGDIWAAGFLFKFYQREEPEKILKFSNFLSSLVVETHGARLSKEQWLKV